MARVRATDLPAPLNGAAVGAGLWLAMAGRLLVAVAVQAQVRAREQAQEQEQEQEVTARRARAAQVSWPERAELAPTLVQQAPQYRRSPWGTTTLARCWRRAASVAGGSPGHNSELRQFELTSGSFQLRMCRATCKRLQWVQVTLACSPRAAA